MRSRLVVWLCVAAMAAGCSSSENGGNGGGGSEPDIPGIIKGAPEGTMAYTIPEGWKATEEDGRPEGYLSVIVRPDKADEKPKVNVSLTLTKVGNILLSDGLEGWAEKAIDGAKSFREEAKIVSNKVVKLGEYDAREVVYTWKYAKEADFTMKTKIWMVQGREDSFSLMAQADTETFAAQEAVIDAAAQSIRFE